MRKLAPLCAIIGILLLSCSSEDDIVVDPAVANDLQVIANAAIVEMAVQVFAVGNDGETPADVDSDTNNNGDTLIDLLPNGQRIANPYTGELTEPRNGAAANPGEIGYTATPAYGVQVVYEINGWGSNGEVASLGNLDDVEQEVRDQAYALRDAAEAFAAANDGVYPTDISPDKTPAGDTVIDLLPLGELMVNPFFLHATNPINGAAANPGEVGYYPTNFGGVTVGYVISGWGLTETIVWISTH